MRFPGLSHARECLKVEEDLESCGGCAYPFSPCQGPGVDCSAIPGAEIVACRRGLCDRGDPVHRQLDNLNRRTCMRAYS
ncbi:hypothetical protein RSAG8_00657, partial [Rhizoctonia solani AG-8 WAC10335]